MRQCEKEWKHSAARSPTVEPAAIHLGDVAAKFPAISDDNALSMPDLHACFHLDFNSQ